MLSPSSVFYSAVYTESLFTLLTLLGLCALYLPTKQTAHRTSNAIPASFGTQAKDLTGSTIKADCHWQLRFLCAVLAFTLATCTRANGGWLFVRFLCTHLLRLRMHKP
jgi:Gpi18-like mannosyltransferase